MLLCPARKVAGGRKDGLLMLVVIVGLIAFAAGAALVLTALRGRLVEAARVRRERDLL